MRSNSALATAPSQRRTVMTAGAGYCHFDVRLPSPLGTAISGSLKGQTSDKAGRAQQLPPCYENNQDESRRFSQGQPTAEGSGLQCDTETERQRPTRQAYAAAASPSAAVSAGLAATGAATRSDNFLAAASKMSSSAMARCGPSQRFLRTGEGNGG